MSLEEMVRELKDRTDILEAKYAYCRHADNLDAEAMVSMFTDDCVVNYMGPDESAAMRGKGALRQMLTEYFRSSVSSSHYVTNAELRFVTEDRVTLCVYMYSWQRFKDFPVVADCHRWGRYEDQLVRTPQGWRISQMRLLSAGEYGGARIGEQIGRRFPPVFQ